MAWILLMLAGALEIVWAFAMKLSNGFTHKGATAVMIVAATGSFGLLTLAMRSLPLGTAYMIWTGIGAVGAFVVGVVFLGEALTATRMIAAALILAGIVTMKVSQ